MKIDDLIKKLANLPAVAKLVDTLEKPPKINTKLMLFGTLFVAIVGGTLLALAPSKNQGYSPVQPLPFSHKTHAGKYQIPCMYCHSSIERSRHATVPAMNICMNCHLIVKADSPHIQSLVKSYSEGKPIPWVKVHDLPEFTFFNHQRHVNKGVACTVCHGEVQEMERIKQFAPLTMGWCVNCHRKPQYNAPTNCDTCHR